ncbi:MAG: hypothetical protein QM730_03985 [Anaerolineales bacterium]
MIFLFEFLVYLLVPLVVPGPGAVLVLNAAAKKRRLSMLHIIWLFVVNFISFVLMLVTLGHSWFGPGDIALCATPIAIAASIQVLFSSRKDILEVVAEDLKQQRYYSIASRLIPPLQLVTMLLGLGLRAFSE